VRQAFYHAIDIEAIRSTVMRGYAEPTGTLITPAMTGYTRALDARLPFDPAKARALLAEAGFARGFAVTLDCPNNRYVNDERICLAVAAMLGKIGVKVSVNAQPKTQFFQKMDRYDTSFYLLGQGTESSDPMQFMSGILHSRQASGWGSNNYAGINDPAMDKLIERVATEMDIIKRGHLVGEVLAMVRDKSYYVPLHRQVIPWVMRKNVTAHHRPSNHLDITSVVVDN
jgi:peptide/nickel transport system substrate-binding protein